MFYHLKEHFKNKEYLFTDDGWPVAFPSLGDILFYVDRFIHLY